MRYRNPLAPCTARARRSGVVVGASSRINASGLACTIASSSGSAPAGKSVSTSPDTPAAAASRTKRSSPKAMRDRESVGEGKRGDLGGRRIIKKKKKERGRRDAH